ncbi:organelle RRM domain-containing protein 6, chloroplastic isoform X2 [Quercus suber]|uniref:organelle RRM domain-containing protein 6, chloroplastic isoform X2 n=1 Tax=Quercus suber TaxID=58331 RepID=UPI000CE21D26|nr:organelle RRM domain-containing protein 6, chloroplastic-like isoform X2 [Quercus suber]POE73919.1 glycine-rich rna-binding protein 4, mitochondrial [Quercus suber]
MALLQSFPSQISLLQLQSHRQFPIPNPSVSETPIPPSISPLISSISLSAPANLHYLSLQSLRCSSSSSFSVHDASPSTKIFIKGLPQSMSEGRLQRTFSQFGEVSQDTKSRQPLGFAYIWFTTEDSAELAVKEMNGKFFDGRFVYVTIAKPAPSKSRNRPYKF